MPPGPILALRHDRSEMQRLSDWLDDRLAVLGLADTTAYAVRICLEEAVLNVVTHSPPAPAAPAEITVSLDRTEGGVVAEVSDYGPSFDPLGVQPVAVADKLLDAPIGGLGITLMRHFARALAYRRVAGRNCLSMAFDAC